MDNSLAIEHNRQALTRIVAALVAMTGFGANFSSKDAGPISRRARNAICRLLRPAESACRRLIIAMASGLVVTLAAPRVKKPRRVTARSIRLAAARANRLAANPPQPRPAAPPTFALSDRPRRVGPRIKRVNFAVSGIPSICIPGYSERPRLPPPITSRDPFNAAPIARRIGALQQALTDLPAQARRLARWRALRERALQRGAKWRHSPLRIGRAPGSRFRATQRRRAYPQAFIELDEILRDSHELAASALGRLKPPPGPPAKPHYDTS